METLNLIEFPFFATILSAALACGLGLIWYHPKVLGVRWMEARGVSGDAPRPRGKTLIVTMLLWLLSASFYSFMVMLLGIDVVPGFFAVSCLIWVAFAMPSSLMGAFYTGYKFEAVSIDAAYHLAGYYVFALVHIVFLLF